ncbi:alpha/beta fold hydrolase [Pseudahrensia aquimaris]|uniref:Alpha/beta fold hydrolase n=1 Tax=Pseudahrensia aquimaris TaxID=744461 RepID=A0ABW3FDF3_9HYPH
MNQPNIAKLPHARIAYYDIGEGKPIVLIHGFASNARVNWIGTNWVKVLNEAGYRCIALDNRGHGESEKFYEPHQYGPDIFARDAADLLDHLGIQRCAVMGYSMGARITAWLCMHHGERVTKAIFGGMGARLVAPPGNYENIAAALETDEPDTIADPGGKMFRKFADATGSDRMALAACIRPSRQRITEGDVAKIETPVLVAVGEDDDVGGSPQVLADLIPGAKAVSLPGLDHMKATGAQPFKDAALDFLKGAG